MDYFDTKDIMAGVLGALGGMLVAALISGFFYELPFLGMTIGAFNMICITWCAQKCAKGITIGGVVRCAVLSLFSILLSKYFSMVYDCARHSFGEGLLDVLSTPFLLFFRELACDDYYIVEFVSDIIHVYILGTIGIVAIAVYKCVQIKREY